MDNSNAEQNNPFMPETAQGQSNAAPVSDEGKASLDGAAGQNPFMPSSGDNTPSSFMDGVLAFNRQFDRIAEGSLALVLKGASKISYTGENALKALEEAHNRKEAELVDAQNRSPAASIVGGVAGALGSGVAYGGAAGLGGGLLKTAATSGGVNAALGYLDYAPDQASRLEKAGVAGTIGAVLPAIGAGATKGFEAILSKPGVSNFVQRLLKPKAAAMQDVAYRAETAVGGDVNKIAASTEAADRLGVQLTPGQALGGTTNDVPQSGISYTTGADQFRAKELGMNANDAMKRKLTEFERPAIEKTGEYINKSIENMAPADAAEKQTNLFSKMKEDYLTADGSLSKDQGQAGIPADVLQNPILKDKLNTLDNAQSEAFKNIPPGSVAYYQKMADSIDDDLYKATSSPFKNPEKSLTSDEKLALLDAKRTLQPYLQQSSDYTDFNNVTKQIKLKEGYQQEVNKAAGGKLPTFDTLHKTLFGSPDKINTFLKDVETTGGDVQQASDVVDVATQLYKSTLSRVSKRLGESGFQIYGNNAGMAKRFVEKLTEGRYMNALWEITLSGNKWTDDVQKVLAKKTEAEQNLSFMKLLLDASKAGATTAASLTGARKLQ